MSNRESHSPSPESEEEQNVKAIQKKTAKDFIFGKLIGEGSFSMVYLAKDIHTNKEYAIKVCEKRHILREKKQKAIMREKQIMNILNSNPSPFFIQLYCTFQDVNRLYFVLNYAKHGELLPFIVKVGSFDVPCTKFYSAELLLALEHLHKLNIIHRDFKPENILLNESMHIQVTDFGSAKVSLKDEDVSVTPSPNEGRKNSFVGTAQYVSPEMLTGKTASTHSDLWAWGCIIYHMLSGLPPFRAPNEYLIFQKIMKLEYDFPDGFPASAKDLIKKLLVIDPSERLGSSDKDGYNSIKNHSFFDQFDWSNLHEQSPPRILPYLPGTSSNEELRSQYQVPDHLEPGLDDKHMTRLLGLGLQDDSDKTSDKSQSTTTSATETLLKTEPEKRKISKSNLLDVTVNSDDMQTLLAQQLKENPWHKFVQGNLILKQGLVEKRKGLFARRRMLLLTTGPRLFYVDPANQVLKGEIPWSQELRPEPKNFKTFFVHTPNRTYYLEDPEGYALEWCRVIEKVRKTTYSSEPQQ